MGSDFYVLINNITDKSQKELHDTSNVGLNACYDQTQTLSLHEPEELKAKIIVGWKKSC